MGMFGLTNYPQQQQTPWGSNPYQTLGTGGQFGMSPFGMNPTTNPYLTQQFGQGQPFGQGLGIGGGTQQLQQILPQVIQLLQTVPQQVQQVQQLQQLLQQQLQQVQQILQIIPAQLQQLQQLIQYIPQQLQQLQQQQPFGQAGLGGFSPWGSQPQSFGTQAHVM